MIRIGDSENRSLRLEFNWKEDKFGTIMDILRVGCVAAMLVFFALSVFGCKDKAEAKEDVWLIVEPNEPVLIFSDQPATIAEIVLEDALDFTFRQDGEELNFNYNEPNVYTYDFEPEKAVSFIINALYKCWVSSDEDVAVRYEPNEPEHVWKCSCGQGWDEMLEIFCGCGKTYKTLDIIMKCIPTWPDYIELEKDLVLRYDFPEPNDPMLIHFPSDTRIISKGTKIYFKE